MNNAITTVILTKNEEKNIEAAITSAKQISARILVIDSGSEDRTVELSRALGAETHYHEWEGHAKQFNWALDHCSIDTPWVFRLDADERISEELAKEIRKKTQVPDTDAYEMRWKLYFMGKWIRHGGTHRHYFLRLFRLGKGRAEEKLLDEHIIVNGRVGRLHSDLIHYDYKSLDAWLNKHIGYSGLELAMYETQLDMAWGNEAQKRKRGMYYRLPLFFRARLYYWYRYYIQLGFLDGKEGRIFTFLQAYWFRYLVDAKIYERTKDVSKE